jgi:hypothetical protein
VSSRPRLEVGLVVLLRVVLVPLDQGVQRRISQPLRHHRPHPQRAVPQVQRLPRGQQRRHLLHPLHRWPRLRHQVDRHVGPALPVDGHDPAVPVAAHRVGDPRQKRHHRHRTRAGQQPALLPCGRRASLAGGQRGPARGQGAPQRHPSGGPATTRCFRGSPAGSILNAGAAPSRTGLNASAAPSRTRRPEAAALAGTLHAIRHANHGSLLSPYLYRFPDQRPSCRGAPLERASQPESLIRRSLTFPAPRPSRIRRPPRSLHRDHPASTGPPYGDHPAAVQQLVQMARPYVPSPSGHPASSGLLRMAHHSLVPYSLLATRYSLLATRYSPLLSASTRHPGPALNQPRTLTALTPAGRAQAFRLAPGRGRRPPLRVGAGAAGPSRTAGLRGAGVRRGPGRRGRGLPPSRAAAAADPEGLRAPAVPLPGLAYAAAEAVMGPWRVAHSSPPRPARRGKSPPPAQLIVTRGA